MYIDTHCHLSVEDYDDIDLIIKENMENNVNRIIVSGCTKNTIIESLDLANMYDCIYLTIGYHPSEVKEIIDKDIELLEEQIKNNSKVVGIGEIGLDYHYEKENKELQINLFRKQMQLAEKLNLPLVFHSRDATLDTINILREFPNVHGVIHCFNGSIETAKIYISLGYKLGIGGVVTFKNCNLSEVISVVGLSSLVLETDAPYLTPVPFRGKINSSKYIPFIAKKIADSLNISIDEVSKVTTENAISLFDLKIVL